MHMKRMVIAIALVLMLAAGACTEEHTYTKDEVDKLIKDEITEFEKKLSAQSEPKPISQPATTTALPPTVTPTWTPVPPAPMSPPTMTVVPPSSTPLTSTVGPTFTPVPINWTLTAVARWTPVPTLAPLATWTPVPTPIPHIDRFADDARWYEEVGDVQLSLESLNATIELYPYLGEPYYSRAIYYLNEAIEIDTTEFLFERGEWRKLHYSNVENIDKAFEDLNKFIELEPNHWIAYALRGFVRAGAAAGEFYTHRPYQKGGFGGGIGPGLLDLDKAIELNPKNPDLYHLRGMMYHSIIRRGLSLTPDEAADRTLQDYMSAIELNLSTPRLYGNIAFLHLIDGEGQETAYQYLTMAIELNPTNIELNCFLSNPSYWNYEEDPFNWSREDTQKNSDSFYYGECNEDYIYYIDFS